MMFLNKQWWSEHVFIKPESSEASWACLGWGEVERSSPLFERSTPFTEGSDWFSFVLACGVLPDYFVVILYILTLSCAVWFSRLFMFACHHHSRSLQRTSIHNNPLWRSMFYLAPIPIPRSCSKLNYKHFPWSHKSQVETGLRTGQGGCRKTLPLS